MENIQLCLRYWNNLKSAVIGWSYHGTVYLNCLKMLLRIKNDIRLKCAITQNVAHTALSAKVLRIYWRINCDCTDVRKTHIIDVTCTQANVGMIAGFFFDVEILITCYNVHEIVHCDITNAFIKLFTASSCTIKILLPTKLVSCLYI